MSSMPFSGFNDHNKLLGMHAFLSASKYHWLNYSEDKLLEVYDNFKASERGTELHEFAATCIKLGQKLPHSHKTLNMYVNDAIGFNMKPETVLFYSEYCFGTADAISFRDGLLRIHDLKTGSTTAHIEQLYIYAALFCLEYHISPNEIDIELRIYQNDEVLYEHPEKAVIMEVCDTIRKFDNLLKKTKEQENI